MYRQVKKSSMSMPMSMSMSTLAGDAGAGAGLVLTTDPKPRLRWTVELHDRFVDAVTQLGGPDKATPKTIMRIMGVKGLTLYHLKSHLQKYRLGKQPHKELSDHSVRDGDRGDLLNFCVAVPFAFHSISGVLIRECEMAVSRLMEGQGGSTSRMINQDMNESIQLTEAFRMQMEVQRRLHDQVEVQRHLQLRIEAQGKYMRSVLEKACQTLAGQTMASANIEARRQELCELATKFSNECLSSPSAAPHFPSLSEMPVLGGDDNQIHRQRKLTDCAVDSCLTSNESFGKIIGENLQSALYCDNGPSAWENNVREDVKLQGLNSKGERVPSASQVENDSERNSISGEMATPTVRSRAETELHNSPKLESPAPKRTTIFGDRMSPLRKGGAYSVTTRNLPCG
eukprot:Gb_17429 [translate_table: standard]